MAKASPEVKKILQAMESEKLVALKSLYDNKVVWERLILMFRDMMYVDADKVLRELGDVKTVDEAIHKVTRQNFYRGRTNAFTLFISMVTNAGDEMERREHLNE